MQNQYNYNTAQYQNAGYFYQYDEAAQKEIIRQTERRSLRKASNGLGWMVIVYFLLMQFIATVVMVALMFTGAITSKNETIVSFLMQIIAAVGASLSAGLFYIMISRRSPGQFLSKSKLTFSKLVPMVMLGMGAAMLANMAANLFDGNISVFGLKNSLSQTTEIQSVPEIVLYIISTAIVPAFAEEFAFRGVFMSVMRKHGDAFAIISSALLFGAMHGNTTQIVFAFILGLIFGIVDCKANSILPSIIIHFLNNFYSVVMDIMANNSGLDEGTTSVISAVIVLAMCVIGILSFIYLIKTDKNFFTVSNNSKNRFSDTDVLTFKEKIVTFMTSPTIIVALCIFASFMIYYLIPANVLNSLNV